ncbi:MAG: hypothetical protein ABIR30_00935 [Chitinophagaceae bacterium]
MKHNSPKVIGLLVIVLSLAWIACNKSGVDQPTGPYILSYGDSIIYAKPSAGDYIISPTTHRDGVYSAFPEGIEIDDNTGAINVTKSETGLRYRITHTAINGTVTNTNVVLSGITFFDSFYNLSQNDSIAFPIYNASATRALPVAGSLFDDGGGANASGCDVKTVNGQINLAQTVRNGLFGNTPANDSRRDIEIVYRLNDNSQKTVNKLKVRLYYYTSMATVAPDLLQTLQDRQTGGVFLRGIVFERTEQAAKPRPPCVIIIAN